MTGITIAFCPQCGTKLPERSKFCPQCGFSISAFVEGTLGATPTQRPAPRTLTTKQFVYIGVIALAIWLPAWSFQQWNGGKRPTQPFDEASNSKGPNSELEHDPEIQKLAAAAKASPEKLEAQQAYAGALIDKLRQDETPSNELIFTAMESLSAVLRLKPADPEALIGMADLSFNQQVFNKASDFYAKYLAVLPEDHSARARYASALSFSGKFDEAIKELNSVLKKDPKNFNAAAYLAVTYAQMGKKVDAIKAGERALVLAPHDEARAKFAQFLDEVKKAPESPERGNVPSPSTQSSAPTAGTSAAQTLAAFVKENAVAGPKFVEAKDDGKGTISLYFSKFPMEGMPPFVKDKFINGIKLKAMDLGVQTLLFIDKDTGAEMARTAIKGNK